jgi:predicted amidohydrolase
MRVALVQLTSTDNVSKNLESARRAVEEAAERGAEFIALPENFAFLRREGNPIPCAQSLDGEIVETVRELASRHRVPILAGTFAEAIEGDHRVYNTSALISETGRIAAVYRKIHLFDVDLSESGGGVFRESAFTAPGDAVVVAETAFGKVGLSVCYDVRFPELYREMAARGTDWITLPSAFAPETGKVHWETLVRARAIENQAFVLAPAQCGQHSPDRASHGHSLIVDPWGRILAEAGDEPAIVVADCDPDELKRVRASLPALRHRKL